jgi:polysaccharide biosynthesis protein PslH
VREETIVFLANRLPLPLDDGWKRRTFHVVRALSTLAPVQLIVFGSPDPTVDTTLLGPGVIVHWVPHWRVPNSVAMVVSLLVRHIAPQLPELLRVLADRHRIVAAGCASVFLAGYLDDLRACVPHAFTFVDTHNIDSLYYQRVADASTSIIRRAALRHTARRTRALEQTAFASATETWVCSRAESDLLARDIPQATGRVVPNGADLPEAPHDEATVRDAGVLFFGRLDYEPNADAVRILCRDIWPLVLATHPEARLRIVGSGSISELIALTEGSPSINLVGRVDDIADELRTAAVVAVPLRSGGGTRLKILEAMAAGCAVVSTSLGAEGIDLVNGEHALIRDSPNEFAQALIELIQDRPLARRLGAAARELVARAYEWRSVESAIAAAVRATVDAP